jgi:hypothetical protein
LFADQLIERVVEYVFDAHAQTLDELQRSQELNRSSVVNNLLLHFREIIFLKCFRNELLFEEDVMEDVAVNFDNGVFDTCGDHGEEVHEG